MPRLSLRLFTTVPVNLFRLGSASGPRLDHIRHRDIDIFDKKFSDGTVKKMVKATGGPSTFDAMNPKLKGDKWWMIPSGTSIPGTVHVIRDRTDPQSRITHYSLRPAREMTLLEFAEGLKQLAEAAQPMFTAGEGEDESKTDQG